MKSYNYILLDLEKPGRYTYGNFITLFFEPFYIGKGKGKRWRAHFSPRRLRMDKNKLKTNKIKKLLEEFIPEQIAVIINNDLPDYIVKNCVEPFLIDIIGRRSINSGPLSNMTNGGDGSCGRSIPHTVEWKSYISVIMTGKKHTQESKEKMSRSKLGIKRGPHSYEHKQKLSEAAKSRPSQGPLSDEHKGKISNSLKGKKKPERTEEHRKNISNAKKGKSTITDEGRRKLSEAGKRPHTDEAKKKISEARKGKPGNGLGRKWITKDGINKRITNDELESFLNEGWNLGRYY